MSELFTDDIIQASNILGGTFTLEDKAEPVGENILGADITVSATMIELYVYLVGPNFTDSTWFYAAKSSYSNPDQQAIGSGLLASTATIGELFNDSAITSHLTYNSTTGKITYKEGLSQMAELDCSQGYFSTTNASGIPTNMTSELTWSSIDSLRVSLSSILETSVSTTTTSPNWIRRIGLYLIIPPSTYNISTNTTGVAFDKKNYVGVPKSLLYIDDRFAIDEAENKLTCQLNDGFIAGVSGAYMTSVPSGVIGIATGYDRLKEVFSSTSYVQNWWSGYYRGGYTYNIVFTVGDNLRGYVIKTGKDVLNKVQALSGTSAIGNMLSGENLTRCVNTDNLTLINNEMQQIAVDNSYTLYKTAIISDSASTYPEKYRLLIGDITVSSTSLSFDPGFTSCSITIDTTLYNGLTAGSTGEIIMVLTDTPYNYGLREQRLSGFQASSYIANSYDYGSINVFSVGANDYIYTPVLNGSSYQLSEVYKKRLSDYMSEKQVTEVTVYPFICLDVQEPGNTVARTLCAQSSYVSEYTGKTLKQGASLQFRISSFN